MKVETTKKRLTQRDWLSLSMDVLSKQGEARLTIDRLCLELGVTKGSFYAHFVDRADFVKKFISYWADNFTNTVVTEISKLEDQSPETRLLALMNLLRGKRFARYDIAVRSWAAHDRIVADGVRKVDRQRFQYLKAIFKEIGFHGAELDIRTRLFVVFFSSEEGMRIPSSGLKVDEEIKHMHAFFTRP